MTTTTKKVHIRWMIARDMPEVTAIEGESFSRPWAEEDFRTALRERNCIGMVAEDGEKVQGFMLYELHERKLELLRFAVGPAWRRQGVGRQMVGKLTSKLSGRRRTRVGATVVEDDLRALKFFHACGFRAVGLVKGLYPEEGLDGVRMVYRVPAWSAEGVVVNNRIKGYLLGE